MLLPAAKIEVQAFISHTENGDVAISMYDIQRHTIVAEFGVNLTEWSKMLSKADKKVGSRGALALWSQPDNPYQGGAA